MKSKSHSPSKSYGNGDSHGSYHGARDHGSDSNGDAHGDHGSSLINVSLLNGIGNGNNIGNGNDISIPLLNGTKVGVGDVLSDNLNIYDSNIANVLFDDVIGKAGIGLDALASVQHVLDGTFLVDLPDLFDHIGV